VPKFQIRVRYHDPRYGEAGLRLAEGPDAESVLLAFLHEQIENNPTFGPKSLTVPEHIAGANGSATYVARGVTYSAVPCEPREAT
jgi:hypothetical protein